MTPPQSSPPDGADWLHPRGEQQGLKRYVEILRERVWLVLVAVVVTTAAAAIYVNTVDEVYKAEADLLVTPVPGDDPTLTGLGLIRQSSDPTRDVETAARLVTTTEVARRVQTKLSTKRSPRSLLGDVSAEPVAQSNIVTITAEGPSPRFARDLANGFGEAVTEVRTARYRSQLDKAIRRLRRRIRTLPAGRTASPDSPAGQLARLEAARGGDDPTLRLETRADTPSAADWPKPKLSIIAGIFAGLVLGVGGAFASQILDPRLRREEQLRSGYRLPVLARVPKETARLTSGALSPHRLSPPTMEAFRALRSTLAASHLGQTGPRAVLITGPSPAEGKTTTSINLAASLVLAGHRVLLVEADLRRPAIGKALNVSAVRGGIVRVLVNEMTLEEALITTEAYGPNLQLLLADEVGEWMADRLSLPAARTLVDDAKRLADYVVIDSPPLTEVVDALPLAQKADDVLLVVRLGKSHLTKLHQLSELLAQHGITPAGFVLVAVGQPKSYYFTGKQTHLDGFGASTGSQMSQERARSGIS